MMDSQASSDTSMRTVTRLTAVEPVRSCGLAGKRIDKEELRAKLIMPEYLRIAVRDAVLSKDLNRVAEKQTIDQNAEPPAAPMVVFINSLSGGRHGPELKHRLHQLIAEEQVRMEFLES